MKKIRTLFIEVSSGRIPDFVIWCFPISGFLIFCTILMMLLQEGSHNDGLIPLNGFAGPSLALITTFLAFLSFWLLLRDSEITEPKVASKVDKQANQTEKKIYALIKIHKGNVASIRLNKKVRQRNTFELMLEEYRFCFYALKVISDTQKSYHPKINVYSDEELMEVSYLFFYWGIEHATALIAHEPTLVLNKTLVTNYVKYLKKHQGNHKNIGCTLEINYSSQIFFKSRYKPFCGHSTQLDPYYNHLFETVKIISTIKKEQDDCMNLLKAQLSGMELLMLYFYSYLEKGKCWISSEYFTEYRFISNLPLALADFGVNPQEKLGTINSKGEQIFGMDSKVHKSHKNKVHFLSQQK